MEKVNRLWCFNKTAIAEPANPLLVNYSVTPVSCCCVYLRLAWCWPCLQLCPAPIEQPTVDPSCQWTLLGTRTAYTPLVMRITRMQLSIPLW